MNESTIRTMFSSASNEWATPQELFDRYDSQYHFTLDACASADNAKCARYFTKEQDALKQEWEGTVWMNPPYGRDVIRWVRKAWQSAQEGKATVVCLLCARTDTKWFHEYVMQGGRIEFIRGRVKFGGSKNPAPFPSIIVIFDRKENPAP